jgi:hypothetical protein
VAGNTYYNVITLAQRCYTSSWAGCGGGGGGTPGGSTTQGQYNNAGAFAGTTAETFRTADGTLSQLANIQYLSCSSDLGAQINTAVTALGSKGVIQLPYGTACPMSTTATAIPPGISIRGYGKLATTISCTVAGDCFQFIMNPTTVGEISSEISSFGMVGSGASNQVLMHMQGASAYTIHDIQFEGYNGAGGKRHLRPKLRENLCTGRAVQSECWRFK